VRYDNSRGLRDSAYGSNLTDDMQNCWQYGNEALGDQMLTDPDYADRDIQLTGISARDAGIVSPGYQYGFVAGLDDDDLMMVAAANDGAEGFYTS
jgi:hypothetical protein